MRDLTVTSFVRSTSGFIGALVLAAISARTQGQSMVAWGNPGFSNVDNLTDVVGVAAGLDHSVALRANGVVAAWGSDGYQQCNPPSNLGNIVEVSAGEGFTIARRPNGTLVGWGLNQYTQTNVPAITDATAIAAGRVHGMALRANGSVAAWGYAADGATTVPSNLGPVGRIAAGFYHSIALQSDGIL